MSNIVSKPFFDHLEELRNRIIKSLLSIILLVMVTATNGVKIDIQNKKYQYYFSVFGASFGKWQKWSDFSCIVLKSSRKKQDRRLTRDFVDRESSTRKFMTSEIYMMDSSHRKKIFCGSFSNSSDANKKAKEISIQLNLPIQKFSPKRIERRR